MSGLSDFTGAWALVGSGSIDMATSDLPTRGSVGPHEPPDVRNRARAWLHGSGNCPGQTMSYVTADGRELQIDATGRLTEELFDYGDYAFLDADGVELHETEPYDAVVLPDESDWVVLAGDSTTETSLRIDNGDIQLRETIEIDEDGDLIRTQHVVTAGRYLSRHALVYRR